ncbi:ArsC family reductase [Endozoicomonas sp. YOMI1]|uniref:ArsC family reductase n=1 Tax=Endozoicomonas sp. YOMI1 TaxID=2828739 RepID=UPI00359FAB81
MRVDSPPYALILKYIGDNVVTIYGIPNCDTIKKARRWLEGAGIEYHFHDYRKDGLPKDMLEQWADELGWEALLNRRGSTWRKLSDKEKSAINAERAITLMLEQPAMIKRPLLDTGSQKLLGFSEEQYSNLLA